MVRLWEPSRTGEASLQNLTFAVKIVRYCGLWRTEGDTKTYMLKTFVISFTFIFGYLKFIYFCFSAIEDTELFIETLSMVFANTPTVVGMYFTMAYSDKFTEIIERIRTFVYFVHSGKEHWKYGSRGHSTIGKKRLTIYYLVSGEISLLNYLLRPIVTHLFFGKKADFPIEQLTMFDYDGMRSFVIQYLAQIFICTSVWNAVISLDILCFNIIVSCSHQLRVLASMILNIANTVSGKVDITWENIQYDRLFEQSPQSSDDINAFSNYSENATTFVGCSITAQQQVLASEELRRIEESLATLSECHQEILKTAGKMSKLLNTVMLSHYLFTSITLCTFTYNAQNYTGQSQLISTGSLLIMDCFRILILGWVSSELSSESLLVADAAYSCNWYNLSLSAKKTLIIMMARAQRPVIIKAGPTGSLSLETCKKVAELPWNRCDIFVLLMFLGACIFHITDHHFADKLSFLYMRYYYLYSWQGKAEEGGSLHCDDLLEAAYSYLNILNNMK